MVSSSNRLGCADEGTRSDSSTACPLSRKLGQVLRSAYKVLLRNSPFSRRRDLRSEITSANETASPVRKRGACPGSQYVSMYFLCSLCCRARRSEAYWMEQLSQYARAASTLTANRHVPAFSELQISPLPRTPQALPTLSTAWFPP